MNNVLLIVMPFAFIENPALGVSLLKSKLTQEGINCHIKHLNLDFAAMIGIDTYQKICRYGNLFLGERLFARHFFSDKLPDDEEFFEYLTNTYSIPETDVTELLSITRHIKPFLDSCIESIQWENYAITGFSSTFEQNIASLTLADSIKKRNPSATIVFGGANCEGAMGIELHKSFSFIDYVCQGDADFSFPELVKRLFAGFPIQDIPGIIYRKDNQSIQTADSIPVQNLDDLPYPDYNDYFDQLQGVSLSESTCYRLHMETSRGCWWGERSQCKFCGLNGGSIHFRSKSRRRIIDEIEYLMENYAKKYDIPQLSMVDNILNMKYFNDLLPELKEMSLPVHLYFEVKTSLNKIQVQMLREAGVSLIGPGIESLNTHVLELMAKGVTALQNVQLLKYAEQFGIMPGWNILSGFPGEKEEDYLSMLELLYKVVHLPPPNGAVNFTLERFSPYFALPESYGILNVRPEKAYRFIYPLSDASIFNLAYYFNFDYRDDLQPPVFAQELIKAVEYWTEHYSNNERLYSITSSPDTLIIEDKREYAVTSQILLESLQKEVYEFCDQIHSFSSILSHIRSTYTNYPITQRDLRDFLEYMIHLKVMIKENDNYLSLAIPYEKDS